MFKKLISIFIAITFSLFLAGRYVVFSQVTWTTYNPNDPGVNLGSNQVYAIAVDPNDGGKTIWAGCRPNDTWGWVGGLSKFNTEYEEWTFFTKDNSRLPENRIWDIDFDSKGNLWIGTNGGGLAKFAPPYGDNDWTVYTEENGLGFKNIYEIAIDENDVLWLGHGAPFPDGNSTAALTIFDGEDQWLVLTKDNSPLEENSCYAITFGLDGDKWLGQKNKGIFRLNDNGTPFDPSDDIWTHYTKSDGMGENTFNSNSADTNINGEVWFGHSRNDSGIWDPGCSRFDGTIWTNYQFGETRIRSITHDAQGNVWLGDKGGEESTGLWKFDGQNWENWNTLNSDLPIDYINDVVIDNQNGLIWIGTFNPDNGDAKGGVVKVEGLIIPVSVELKQSSVPSEFYLAQNYPNPFNPVTTINYDIPQGMGVHVKIEIFNLRGQPVSILVDKTQQAGHYSARWDGKDFDGRKAPSGIYWYQLTAGQHTLTRKMVLVY